jgi:hypothetical protein
MRYTNSLIQLSCCTPPTIPSTSLFSSLSPSPSSFYHPFFLPHLAGVPYNLIAHHQEVQGEEIITDCLDKERRGKTRRDKERQGETRKEERGDE